MMPMTYNNTSSMARKKVEKHLALNTKNPLR